MRRKNNQRREQPPAGVPVEKNGEYIADVIGIGHDGEGVGRVDGFTLFIHGALPGERVRVKVLKVKKQYGYAKLLEILDASPDRVDAPCPIYKQCGGCQLQHLSYEAQLRWKRQLVIDNLTRIGKLQMAGEQEEGVIVRPTLGMSDPWRYRNKAQVPIGLGSMESGLVGGFYAQGSHRIIDMEACLIQHENNDTVVAAVKRIARQLGIRPYDEDNGKGLLRHVIARYGFNTGEIMVVLVTNGRDMSRADELVGLIRKEIPGVRSICQNVNMERTNVIFGDETKVLWGRDVIYDTIGDIRFAISARSFYQVNPVQTEVLYGKALEYAQLSGEEVVIDAYCGIGTISLFLAQRAGKVYGVEIVPEAIEDARRNALLNGVRNAVFKAGAAELVIPAWKQQGVTPDTIVVDPPRKGCDAALLETIVAMRPERVVYVSCNPSTLARDLRVLEDGGYRTVEVQPVDMFPHTVHVEVVCSLIYKGFDSSKC
ncbi:SAM-dependent methyltransferase [Mycobacterium tuberculosis]|nr:SAM-dependent methyltransferase [Mycobacterium tuberculosis]